MQLRRLIIPALAVVIGGSCGNSEGLAQLGTPLDRPPLRPRRVQLPDPTPAPVARVEQPSVVAPAASRERIAAIPVATGVPPASTPVITPTITETITEAVPDVRMPELDCTPRDAVGYRKGRRTPIQIVSVDGSPVERATANAFWAMSEAAAKDGVELTIYSAFRSPEEQEYFYECYRTCSCNGCSQAAKPGFSNHQMGKALDIAIWSPEVHPWLAANAKRFGFAATVKGEPWHWEFKGKPKKKGGVCK